MRGLAPDEAANLTAYLAGIAVGDAHWTLARSTSSSSSAR